jgi:hypothetical protein
METQQLLTAQLQEMGTGFLENMRLAAASMLSAEASLNQLAGVTLAAGPSPSNVAPRQGYRLGHHRASTLRKRAKKRRKAALIARGR